MTWLHFASTTLLIFLAALPGRTTFLIMLLASKNRALATFSGSSLAFLAQSLISVLLGGWLSQFPQRYINFGCGLLFLYFAVATWREKTQTEDPAATPDSRRRNEIQQAFTLIFAAEWGDVSQLAIASIAAQQTGADSISVKLTVWLGAALALVMTSALATVVGSHSHRILHPRLISKTSALVFAGVGAYLLYQSTAG